jgi:hypothetical protein
VRGRVKRLRVAAGDVAALVAADTALEPLRSPEIACDVDVTAPRPDGRPGWARLRCRHGLRGDRVASTATAGGTVEVAAYAVEHWQTELARAATVPLPEGGPRPPDDRVDMPLEVLLAAGEAVRSGRADVLDELVRRARAQDPGGLRDQLVRLHTAAAGRLVATVATRGSATPRLGWVSWVLFADGWRSLTPLRQEGRPIVHVAPATPLELGAQVAALVTRVQGRW